MNRPDASLVAFGATLSMLAAFLIVLGLLAGCAPLPPSDVAGGNMLAARAEAGAADTAAASRRIEGWCVSACIQKLRARNICYAADATFWLHAATYEGSPGPGGRRKRIVASDAVYEGLPNRLLAWAREHRAFETTDFTPVSAAEMAKLDDTDRTCRDREARK